MTRVEEIKSYRVANQCGLQEAKHAIDKRYKLERLTRLQTRVTNADNTFSLASVLREVIEEMLLEVRFS
jgi:hypothetical protein